MIPAILVGAVGKIAAGFLKKKLAEKLPDEVKDVVMAAVDEIKPEEIQGDPEMQSMADEFSDSFLAYYGKFDQLPPSVQVLRAMQRPVVVGIFCLTYVGVIFYALTTQQLSGTEALGAVGGPMLTIVGFLFGERSALKQPGSAP